MSKVTKGVVVPLDVAELIIRVFLPANEQRMRKAHPDTVAAVTAFKNAVNAGRLQHERADAINERAKGGR